MERVDNHLLHSAENAEALRSRFKDPDEVFDESIQAILSVLKSCDNRSLICHLSEAYLVTFGHVQQPELEATQKLSQSHIEFLQFLIARGSLTPSILPPTAESIDIVLRSLLDASMAFLLKRLKAGGYPDPKNNVIESVRMHTQSVRNVGYPQQIKRITTDILKPLDSEIEKNFGIKGSNLVELLFSIENLIETRLREQLERLLPVLVAESLPEIYSALDTLFPDTSHAENLAGFTLDEVKLIVYEHSLAFNFPRFTLTLCDLKPLVKRGISDECLVALLNSLSANFGETTKTLSIADGFLSNPVLTKPLLKFEETEWLCPIPGLLVGETLALCEALFKQNDKLKKAVEKQRYKYLERETCRLVKNAFPSCQTYPNVTFRVKDAAKGETDQGETDVLVLAPPFLIPINCKSHSFSIEARRGAESISEEIAKIISHPAKQSKSLLTELKKVETLELKSGKNRFSISTTDFPMSISISVVLEALSSLLSNLSTLEAAGLIEANSPKAPIMPVTDLEGVLEILPSELQRMHYLLKRNDIENDIPHMSNEFGLLFLYLHTSLDTELELYQKIPMLPLYGSYFDPYFMQEWTKEPIERPKHRVKPYLRQLVQKLEVLKPEGWRAIGIALLDLPRQFCQRLEDRLSQVAEALRNGKQVNNMLEISTNLEIPQCLIFWIHPQIEELAASMKEHADDLFRRIETKSIAVIWIDPTDLSYESNECRLFFPLEKELDMSE